MMEEDGLQIFSPKSNCKSGQDCQRQPFQHSGSSIGIQMQCLSMKITSGKNSVSLRHVCLKLSPFSHQLHQSGTSARAGQQVNTSSFAAIVLVVIAVASEWGNQQLQTWVSGKQWTSRTVEGLSGSSWMQDNERGLAKLSTCLGLTRSCDVHSRDWSGPKPPTSLADGDWVHVQRWESPHKV